jgi:hypothetical protein
VPRHIHIPSDHGITTPRIPTSGGSNKEAQKFLVLCSAFGSSQKHIPKREIKETVKDHKIGWSLNGNDKRKISPVILIFPAIPKFTTYNIRWNLSTGNVLRVKS